MILVVDSSTLIALARIGRLELLHEIAGDVHIAAAVLQEVSENEEKRIGASEVQRAPWIRVERARDRRAVESLKGRLGSGEAESIVLARELSADFLVLDDATARRTAEKEGARVIGLLGLLVHARQQGRLAELKPLLEGLRATGFHMGESLYRNLLRRVGEA